MLHRDLMSQAAAEGAMQLAAAMVADAPAPRRKLRREILFWDIVDYLSFHHSVCSSRTERP
ncbi:hypothetical protein CGS55_04165 [Faecalibacterium prausnitzii]|uniref:Uncharacterized protein n=2 Tax=Faecalibacterium prausnitzii TaxID=853 RepID=A0A2A7A236_9FIRM|nr:hypothetical protein CGS55_04165 [Faecalibacterium prausnitzii]RAW64602.1 hypothetical protein C4N21_09915 [Faecalibacterium prausnitzii]RGC18349.1 hypothetical protein DW855_08645 [Faecalibacterium prausnitzii]